MNSVRVRHRLAEFFCPLKRRMMRRTAAHAVISAVIILAALVEASNASTVHENLESKESSGEPESMGRMHGEGQGGQEQGGRSLLSSEEKDKAMADWRSDDAPMNFKLDRRRQMKASSEPDMFGPLESHPCPAMCKIGNLPIENTLCPMMFPAEQKTVMSYLKPTSVVFEWGSGASTMYFSQCVKSWTSIEHETEWCNIMKRMVPPNTRVECIPIEAEYKESFGSPGTWDGSHKEFKTYVEAAQLMERSSDNSTVDVVIVDGRARGDCALEALPYMREDSVLFIHDYIHERLRGTEQYGKALAAFDMIELVKSTPGSPWRMKGGLAVYRPKPEILREVKERMAKAREAAAVV